MAKTALSLAVVVSMLGCVAARHVRVAPLFADDPYWSRAKPRPPSEVIVTEGDLLREYRPIARIIVDSVGSDRSITKERMRKEAARIGADAVIKIGVTTQYEGQDYNLYTGKPLGPVNRHMLEGTAVVFVRDTRPIVPAASTPATPAPPLFSVPTGLKVGMSFAEVEALLGAPKWRTSFQSTTRWDYAEVIIIFEDGRSARFLPPQQ